MRARPKGAHARRGAATPVAGEGAAPAGAEESRRRLPRPSGAPRHAHGTRLGEVDLLGWVGEGEYFEDLLPFSDWVDIGGVRVRVLRLTKVIETKERAGRDKDKAALHLLRETLRMRGEE